tara:strand:- start:426 stop:977 length:552 start_codon:yes stop_codon:yes gene_type:complete
MKYAKTLPKFIDTSFLKDIINELVNDNWRQFTDAEALQSFTDHYKIMVDDYEQLQVIKTAYPKFDNYLKILKMGPNGTWPISTTPNDNGGTLCIPIENSKLSISFFKDSALVEGVEDYIGAQFGYWETNPWAQYHTGGTKDYTHLLNDTTIIDASVPKQFVNSSDELSLFVLWKYRGNFEDFE